ncbi:hypothetical protein QWY28_11760 [Nocardioides sp. SOB77]|uniref:Calcium-binding protein n=1 Tax=Nocardioides oceani TaxID=3058369 RepID=A0ABT8FGR5_9ACTN|nr:hypothetical protein [Nocardioides oceani]MDN4173625.1 hypothetical protein [Nocardioides oceani]
MRTLLAAALVPAVLLVVLPAVADEPAPPAPATCDGLVATIVGTGAGETITGTDGDDVIAALGGADRVEAGAGDDVVCGDDGGDVLAGGPGADRLLGGLDDTDPDERLGGDLLEGGPGDDRLDAGHDPSGSPNRDRLSWRTAPRGVRVDLHDGERGVVTGHGRDVVVLTGTPLVAASRYADLVLGSPGDDRVRGLLGGDTIRTGAGDDAVVTDAGRRGGPAPDVVEAGAGDDTVVSAAGRDRIDLGRGADSATVSGRANAIVDAGPGDDHLSIDLAPGPGPVLRGGTGLDRLALWTDERLSRTDVRVDLGRGVVRPRRGGTTPGRVRGLEQLHVLGTARWTVRGTGGPDVVSAYGADLPVAVRLGRGPDEVEGGSGDDLLDGGPGRDRVDGGEGRDRCPRAERALRCEVRR